MVKYRVIFEFRNDLGEWVETYLDDNGNGLCEDDAIQLAREMVYRGHRCVRYEEMPMKQYEIGFIDGYDLRYKVFKTEASCADDAVSNMRDKYGSNFEHRIAHIMEV